MNSNQSTNTPSHSNNEEGDINLIEYIDILLDNRWLVFLIIAISTLVGVAYALVAQPLYESNLMVQVEDSDKSAGSFLGDAASSVFDVKTPAAGEIEIIRSRMILGQAVENTKIYINATPRFIPVIGSWMSRRATSLSKPGFLGLPGYVNGTENITVPQLEVSTLLEGTNFVLVLDQGDKFVLRNDLVDKEIHGQVGVETDVVTNVGRLKILVSAVSGLPGAQFNISAASKSRLITSLQSDLRVVEKGRQSGVIDVTWQNADRKKLVDLLNEIGRIYVRQNIERKAAEAEKTLGFLNTELPKFKDQLERSEDAYNRYRNKNGTVNLEDEAKNALQQLVDLQGKLVDAQQKRRELSSRFTDKHPNIETLDAQISAWTRELSSVDSNIRRMPMLQQSALRMQRDIKVNTDLYVSLLNSSLQMRLAKEGKVGNVRLLDDAVTPENPIKPQKRLVVTLAVVLGSIFGVAAAIVRSSFFGGIRNPNEIESQIGLNVYSTIPLSLAQRAMDVDVAKKIPGLAVLASISPNDPAIESLRSLRTALQFAMLEAANNRILISGATPGVGKSFISANFATIVAASGKKVLLIDADLRKGYLNQVFAVPRPSGLSELVAGTRTIQQVVHREILPNLDFITTGVYPPNPAELLMSESFGKVLNSITAGYDLVIIDTPPVLVAADTAAVAHHAGTVLLVARAEKTHLGELLESAKRLTHVGCQVNGVILNGMDMSRRHYGRDGYKYGAYRYTQYNYQALDN